MVYLNGFRAFFGEEFRRIYLIVSVKKIFLRSAGGLKIYGYLECCFKKKVAGANYDSFANGFRLR